MPSVAVVTRSLVLGAAMTSLGLAGCGADRGTPSTRLASTPPRVTTSATTAPGSGPASLLTPSAPATSTPFDPAHVSVELEPFVAGFDAPLAIVNASDGSGRLFVVEQGGQVRIVRDGALEGTPFLDVADEITSGGERGLLGLAFAPQFPGDPRVFVDYTDRNGDTQVSSFRLDGSNPDRVDPSSELHILSVKQPFANHNGGAVVFDRTGMLLVSLGDGGSGGDPHGNGQSLTTLLGKIVRIDVTKSDRDHPYAIPADNPYADGAAGRRPEIWLSGLRNPWRISVDRATGDLWIGDVGQSAWEEIDVQRAGSPGGTNFGWNRMEGSHCYEPATDCEKPDITPPVTEYGHDAGCTVIGGEVDRSRSASPLSGGYLFGDYCSGRLWAIDPAVDGYRAPTVVGESDVSLSAFGKDESGELYAADISGGRILHVVAERR